MTAGWAAWAARFRSPTWLRALSVVAAGVILGEVNLLASRHFTRFDVTQEKRFTLSEETVTLLHSQTEPLEIVSLLSDRDPLAVDARHLLDAYRAECPLLRVSFVDPERDAAAFLALGQKYDIAAEENPSGVVIAEASFLVRRAEKNWFVRGDQLVSEDESGRVKSQLEARLSEAIAHVSEQRPERICFVSGHGERSIDDAGPDGLGELSRRLSKSNLLAVRVPLDVPMPEQELSGCHVIAVVAPERPWPSSHTALLRDAFLNEANVLLLIDPLVERGGALAEPGLTPLLELLGVAFRPGFVIEGDPKLRLPRGVGESFFAEVQSHPITRGLSTEAARLDARPLAVALQPLSLAASSPAVPLLKSSKQARLLEELTELDVDPDLEPESFVLAAAAELPQLRATGGSHPRAVVVGGSTFAAGESFRDPKLYGNRLFVENALSWLAARPRLVAVPERTASSEALILTESSLTDLLLYVVVYMPATAGLLGLFVLLRRRRRAARLRQESTT